MTQQEREIRFGVVMYGGVSLAIYMNGIAQELLYLVQSTAPGVAPKPGTTAAVYREIAQKLAGPANDDGSLPIKFVVDIISGSSAGGINAVFLAKALACGNANLGKLADMWLKNADVDQLLNDTLVNDPDKGNQGFFQTALSPR